MCERRVVRAGDGLVYFSFFVGYAGEHETDVNDAGTMSHVVTA